MASSSQGTWFYQRDADNGVSQGFTTSSRFEKPSIPFGKRSERVDWKKIASIDIDRIARNLDYNSLQNNLPNVTYCNIELETDTRTIDPNFVKLFKLSQLSIEYLLHSQDYLSTLLTSGEEATKKAQQDLVSSQKQVAQLQDELASVKKESHKRKKLVATLQQMLQAGSYHKCHYCYKAFVSAPFLQSHIERRHSDRLPPPREPTPPPVPPPPSVLPETVNALQAELLTIQQRLALTEEQLIEERNARNALMQKVKSDQAKHELMKERDMDKWKDEQLKKHERELNDMKELLSSQLRDLEAKYQSEHAALSELQNKFSQKQSHLGELQDADSIERRRLKEEIDLLQNRLNQQDGLQQQNAKLELRLMELERRHNQMLEDERRRQDELMRSEVDSARRFQEQEKEKAIIQAELRALQEQVTLSLRRRSMEAPSVLVKMEEMHAVGSMMERPRTPPSEDDIDGRIDRDEELRRRLESDPGLLKQLKIEINGMLAIELEKRGISRDTKGINNDMLREKMKLLQNERHLEAKMHKNLTSVRQKYKSSLNDPEAASTSLTTPIHDRKSSRLSFNDTPSYQSDRGRTSTANAAASRNTSSASSPSPASQQRASSSGLSAAASPAAGSRPSSSQVTYPHVQFQQQPQKTSPPVNDYSTNTGSTAPNSYYAYAKPPNQANNNNGTSNGKSPVIDSEKRVSGQAGGGALRMVDDWDSGDSDSDVPKAKVEVAEPMRPAAKPYADTSYASPTRVIESKPLATTSAAGKSKNTEDSESDFTVSSDDDEVSKKQQQQKGANVTKPTLTSTPARPAAIASQKPAVIDNDFDDDSDMNFSD